MGYGYERLSELENYSKHSKKRDYTKEPVYCIESLKIDAIDDAGVHLVYGNRALRVVASWRCAERREGRPSSRRGRHALARWHANLSG